MLHRVSGDNIPLTGGFWMLRAIQETGKVPELRKGVLEREEGERGREEMGESRRYGR
jgi:hypothetical protein